MATKQEIMHPDCLQDLLERYSGDCDLSHYITMLDVPRGVFNKRLAKMFAKGHVQRTVDTMMQENDANPDGAKIPQEMLQAVITKMNDWVCNLKLGLTQSYEQYRAMRGGPDGRIILWVKDYQNPRDVLPIGEAPTRRSQLISMRSIWFGVSEGQILPVWIVKTKANSAYVQHAAHFQKATGQVMDHGEAVEIARLWPAYELHEMCGAPSGISYNTTIE